MILFLEQIIIELTKIFINDLSLLDKRFEYVV